MNRILGYKPPPPRIGVPRPVVWQADAVGRPGYNIQALAHPFEGLGGVAEPPEGQTTLPLTFARSGDVGGDDLDFVPGVSSGARRISRR